jgi:Hemerythrin HHE cation binding domain
MWPFSIFQSKAVAQPLFQASTNATAKSVAPAAAKPVPVPVPAPAVGITYNPNLIAKLKDDHQELFAVYTRLHESATSARFAKITDDLIVLRRAFNGHILLENVRFYVYLEKLLKEHPEEKNYVHSLRKDMNGIAGAVSSFCERWITQPVTTLTQSTFTAELQGIGGALTSRVELEETTLYTLYGESL